jgi:hypothetical protein
MRGTRNKTVADGQRAKRRFHRAREGKAMTGERLGAADARTGAAISENCLESDGFGASRER